jgi:hypothetical protein
MPSTKVYQIFAKVHTPVGIFTGFVSSDIATLEEAIVERNTFQEIVGNSDYKTITFFSDENPGTEITISHSVAATSVFELFIVDCLKD